MLNTIENKRNKQKLLTICPGGEGLYHKENELLKTSIIQTLVTNGHKYGTEALRSFKSFYFFKSYTKDLTRQIKNGSNR